VSSSLPSLLPSAMKQLHVTRCAMYKSIYDDDRFCVMFLF
jgi:hypothetical protein